MPFGLGAGEIVLLALLPVGCVLVLLGLASAARLIRESGEPSVGRAIQATIWLLAGLVMLGVGGRTAWILYEAASRPMH